MDDMFGDPGFVDLTNDEALAEIEAFYGPGSKSSPSGENAATVAPSQALEEAVSTVAHDEFAGLMDDIDNFTDAFADETAATTAALGDPSAPTASESLAPGIASSIPPDEQHIHSPILPREGTAGVAGQELQIPEAPSSGDRSLMQAEMRKEEGLHSSPIRVSPRPNPVFSHEKNALNIGGQSGKKYTDQQDPFHVTQDHTPRTALNECLLAAKSSPALDASPSGAEPAAQNPTSNEEADVTQKIITQTDGDNIPTAQTKLTTPLLPKPQDLSTTKRRREPSPPVVPSNKKTQADDSSPQRPPVKKQKSHALSTSPEKPTVTSTKRNTKPSTQSDANQAADSKPSKSSVGESDSSLTELSSEHKSTPPVAKDASESEEMATSPAVSSGAKTAAKMIDKVSEKAGAKTASEEDTAAHNEGGDTEEITTPNEEPADTPTWNFDAVPPENNKNNNTATPSEEQFEEPVDSPTWGFSALGGQTPVEVETAEGENGEEKVDTPVPSPKKKATKSKAKPKSKPQPKPKAPESTTTVKKRGRSVSTEPSNKTPPIKKGRVGGNELKDIISNNVLKGVRKMNDSPRKTRGQRKDEEDAKPNAASAVQRRRSAGATGGKPK